MAKNTRHAIEKLSTITTAWRTHAPKKTISGMTVAQFEETIKSSFETRNRLKEIESERTGLMADRDDADKANLKLVSLIVNAVRGDPAAGDDSKLYEAMGYVRASDRKSGLTRARKAAEGGEN